MAQANVRLTVDATGATNALRGVQSRSVQLQRSFGGLQSQINKVVSALALVGTSRFVFFKTAELETQRKSLEVLTGSVDKTNQIIKELQDFGAVTPFTSSELIEQTKLLKAFGFETDELVDITKRLADIAGATGKDLRGISTAFGQIRAKGKLQQEENLQLLERGVNITKELERITGLSGEAFQKAQREGKIGAEEVNQALINLTNEGGAFFKGASAQADTLNGKVSTLQDTVDTLARTIGDDLSPVIKSSVDSLTALTKATNNFLQSNEGQTAFVITGIALAVKGVTVITPILIGQLLAAKVSLSQLAVAAQITTGQLVGTQATLKATSVGFASATAAANAFKIALAKLGIGLAIIALGAFVSALIRAKNEQKKFNEIIEKGSVADVKSRIEEVNEKIKTLTERVKFFNEKGKLSLAKGAEEDIEEAAKQLDKLKNRLLTIEGIELFNDFEKAKNALIEKNKQLKITEKRLKIETEEGRKQFENDLKRKELVDKFGEDLANELIELQKKNKLLKEGVTELEKQEEAASKLKEKFMEIGKGVEDGIVSNLADAVMGTKTLAQAAVNVLNDLKRALIEVAIQRSIAGLGERFGGFLGDVFKNLGKRANGGPVSAGGAFLVGEKGPEILQMGSRGGTIIPNNQLGGGTTNIVNVSVDAAGTAVSGNNQDAQALGNVIGAAIRAELIKEKRAGGLLSR